MCRLFKQQVEELLDEYEGRKPVAEEITLVTGVAAYNLIEELAQKIMEKLPLKINVVKIINSFFGERITVSGLTTGKDIIDQLKGKNYKNIIIPNNMINDNNVMLDDLTIEDLEKELNAEIAVCDVDGEALLNLIAQ